MRRKLCCHHFSCFNGNRGDKDHWANEENHHWFHTRWKDLGIWRLSWEDDQLWCHFSCTFLVQWVGKVCVGKCAVACGSHCPDTAALEDNEFSVLGGMQAEPGGPLIRNINSKGSGFWWGFTGGQLRSLLVVIVYDYLHAPIQPQVKSLCMAPYVCVYWARLAAMVDILYESLVVSGPCKKAKAVMS